MAIIGIDNGVTGSIGFITKNFYDFKLTPSFETLNYTTSKKKNFKRLDFAVFRAYLREYKERAEDNRESIIAYLERPMVNPVRFDATLSGIRCLESQIIALECLKIPYTVIDSKQWQKELLPSGISSKKQVEKNGKKTTENELKKASEDVAIRLFPNFKELIEKHKDGDGLLIARYGKLKEREDDF